MKTYNYFNNPAYSIDVTDKTLAVAPYTFQSNGEVWENLSIQQFFDAIAITSECNIVDIGAQVGLYSLFAKYRPYATFYAFEPFPDTFNILNDNIKLNNISNVKTFNQAISDKESIATLNTSISHNGLHTMGDNPLRFSDVKQIQVATTSLDIFFKDIPVHYIKIDTEGYEYFILKGGESCIRKYKPLIQLEWNVTNMQQCNVTESMLQELIGSLDYKVIASVEEEKLIGPK